ncbi:3-phosphoshikimate 1-carboxyvinyltransferase [Nonlabens dokdonensis]|jgi:3-phosphoshikimate 1-carboxyvinyltransferase|uniref:3-phosphoshikimate 1-carboxyvinyltransferase n=2 Tax=Nonlabens dokdonensis TaxID=328515 RepID=L7WDR5_NONDD|nr:3-phosphoshikimate 1-carboxyvinyltransferase [Nonlabens dokdonensis]AGC77038.1 3-phosphoshikimate 1-carboxyvinyltransferase [Nonlabens dokdonensis DSW-6]PZX41000.1 3-phosphoshikimate 1-carboxyvinyltransferase [Nonlabens dokdonensis]
MDFKLHKVEAPHDKSSLQISGSKSESNRWLILQALYENLIIQNISDSDDSKHLNEVLQSDESVLDIGHAGTAMRFGTAFFATQENKDITLTGSARMKQRPIGILVDALNKLGAQVSYLEKEGYPPLRIKGSKICGGKLSIDGSVSSQFLSAILLVAPRFEKGLELHVTGELTSKPYLEMTLGILKQVGVKVSTSNKDGNYVVHISPLNKSAIHTAVVESDWSSAGYWYSWVALQEEGNEMQLSSFNENSLQGDSELVHMYLPLGVKTTYGRNSIKLAKIKSSLPRLVELDLTKEPDQAQTIFATCLALGVDARLTGLHTLKIKETDRIEAMKVVGSRFRESEITTTNNSIHLHFEKNTVFNKDVLVDTFQDHRMAMAFAPLAMKTSLIIKDAMVVTKSYKNYYKDLKTVNVSITEI